MTERLTLCAIQRDGVHHHGFHSHWELRLSLDPNGDGAERPGDVPGFMTSTGRFITRREAVKVGLASGQLNRRWEGATRDVLSSDIGWNEGR